MTVGDRIFFPCQGVYLTDAKAGLADHFLNGVQSLAINNTLATSFIRDVGKSQGSNLNLSPAMELTIERVMSNINDLLFDPLDPPTDYKTGFLLNSANLGTIVTGNPATDLRQFDLKVVYGDPNNANLSGTSRDIITYNRCLLTNLTYTMDTGGPFKESYTFGTKIANKLANTTVPANNTPITLSGNREILMRQHFDVVNSILPTEVSSIANVGDSFMGSPVYRITSLKIEVNLNYSRKVDIGRWRGADVQSQLNMWTSVNLPIEITCTFEIDTTKAYVNSILNSDKNFTDQRIVAVLKSKNDTTGTIRYYVFDLGLKNRLTSLGYSGGSTSGERVSCSLSYKNSNNDFAIYTRTDTNIDQIKQNTESY